MACSRLTHRILHIATGLVVVVTLLAAGAVWRLSQGPVQIGWLANRVNAMVSDESAPVHAKFRSMALAWEGFHAGVDYPLDLRISGIVLSDRMSRTLAEAPDAHVTFSLAALLLGRVVPRTIEVDHARIAITRAANGVIASNWGETDEEPGADTAAESAPTDLRALLAQVSRPAGSDRGGNNGMLDQLRRVHFRDTVLTMRDRASGMTAATTGANLDLRRLRSGHVSGFLNAPMMVGGQPISLTGSINFNPGSDTTVDAKLTPFRPAAISNIPAGLSAIDLPVSMNASLTLSSDFRPQRGKLDVHLGTGMIALGKGHLPLRGADLAIDGTPDGAAITQAILDVSRTDSETPELVTLSGQIRHVADRVVADLIGGVRHIDMADLPRVWPEGVGGGARAWITTNILGGIINTGSGSFTLEADGALHDVVLTKATAAFDGVNGAFTWLDDVPPVEQAQVHLRLTDPDTLEIQIPNARQRIHRGDGDLTIKDGRMRITGLAHPDQFATIRTSAEGPVTSVLALLKEPRLRLLSAHPISLKPAAGDASAILDFQFPLEEKLQIDDISIHAQARLRNVSLPDAVAGRDLTDSGFDLNVDKNGLSMQGKGVLAGIPVSMSGVMDFSSGAPDQVVRKLELTARASAAQLDAAGLRVSDVVDGVIPVKAVLTERRGGNSTVALNGDLTEATLSLSPLAWTKSAGTNASASATLIISKDKLSRIERIALRGDGLQADGSVDCAGGQPRSIQIDAIRLGRTEAHGTVILGQPISIVLQGGQIDLAPKLAQKSSPATSPEPPPVTKPAWTLDASFEQALLANNERASSFVASAKGDGETIQTLNASGAFSPTTGLSVRIDRGSAGRRLHVEASDAGRFLSGVDVTQRMQGGRFAMDGTFGTATGYHPLTGTVDITDTRVKNSPMLGKLLQAITLYGLVDALRGPGMVFSHVIVPFRYEGARVILNEARAFNPSLGLTAQGSIELASQRMKVGGTIVPAYFFNTLLGRLPLVGRLFSPELGGGVFAFRYGMDGPIDDATISVNPISGLTPGFLRQIFGVFDSVDKPGGR